MKLFYLNDEPNDIIVKVMDTTWDYTYTHDNSNNYYVLKHAEGRVFDLMIPDGAILWIKKWTGTVMLSFYVPSAPVQPEEPLPRSGAV